MEFFKKIRLKVGESMLQKKAVKTKRKIQYSNLSQVKSIGIVWDASKVDEFAALLKFCKKMSDSARLVKILGYFNGKDVPAQYTANRYLTILKRAELNFFYHPVSSETSSFIRTDFGVLIDLNFKNLLPLRYVSAMSEAHLKVGLSKPEKNNSIFDLMIDLRDPFNIEDYLNNTIHYLEMINSESVKLN